MTFATLVNVTFYSVHCAMWWNAARNYCISLFILFTYLLCLMLLAELFCAGCGNAFKYLPVSVTFL